MRPRVLSAPVACTVCSWPQGSRWPGWLVCRRASHCPMSGPRLTEDVSSGLGGAGSPRRPTGAPQELGPGSSCDLAACLIRLRSELPEGGREESPWLCEPTWRGCFQVQEAGRGREKVAPWTLQTTSHLWLFQNIHQDFLDLSHCLEQGL